MPYNESETITIPALSLKEAYICLWFYHQGSIPNNRDRCGSWRECAAAMGARHPHPFAPYDDMTKLRDTATPAILRFPAGQAGGDRHHLPMACFRDPEILFEAINDAERRNNQAVRDTNEHNRRVMAERAAGKSINETQPLKRVPWPGVEVELTPAPAANDASRAAPGNPAATTVNIGDIVTRPDGVLCEVVKDRCGKAALKPLESTDAAPKKPGKDDRAVPPRATQGHDPA